MTWQLQLAIFSGVLSAVSLGYLAMKLHNKNHPKNMSELAITSNKSLWYFRIVLWVSAILFGLSLYTILFEFKYSFLVFISANLAIGGALMLAIFPLHEGWNTSIHNAMAHVMALGMVMLALAFGLSGEGIVAYMQYFFLVSMLACAYIATRYLKYFIHFEMLFICTAHVSIIAALYFISL
jgi:hypothetical protein